MQLLLTTTTAIICILLYYNFKFEAGQLVEPYLVQTRDVNKVLYSALHGKYVCVVRGDNKLVIKFYTLVHINVTMPHLS